MSTEVKRLYRSSAEKMFNGVCGGLGTYFNIDPTLVRLIFVAATLLTGPVMLLVYLLLAVIIPQEPVAYLEDVESADVIDPYEAE